MHWSITFIFIFQVAKGLKPPLLTMCNYQLLSVPMVWRDLVGENPLPKTTLSIFSAIYGSTNDLADLISSDQFDNEVANHPLLMKLISIKEGIPSNLVAFPLFGNIQDMTFEEIFDDLGQHWEDTIRYCSNAGMNCTNITKTYSGEFPNCFVYDTKEQGTKDTVLDEGLSNGLTLILMTGGHLATLDFRARTLPDEISLNTGYANTFWPNSADGFRIMLSGPGEKPDMDEQGVNISPGSSTLIAVTGKEIIRLSWPYSACTNTNQEMQLLLNTLVKSLNYKAEYFEDLKSKYTQQQCRSACLQRHIFKRCSCLEFKMRNIFSNIEKSIFCGTLSVADTNILLNVEQYDRLTCFTNATELVSDKCNFLHKMINDTACVKQVKQEFTQKKLSGNMECDCPPACYSYEYFVSTSQSPWPNPGPETHAAYAQLVHNAQWSFKGFLDATGNGSLSRTLW